jgi:lysophospholipase L1-like esterase
LERRERALSRSYGPHASQRRRLGRARALVLALSILISLAIVEAGLRLTNAYGGQAYSVSPTGSQYKFYEFDPVLGWANAPGMHGVYERDEFRFPIRVNSFGMRDVEIERAPGPKKRIAVLGDSFTWGIGVADEDRFTEQLELARGVETLNFGVAGYAPIQYSLMMDEVLAFEPEIVVVAFCLGNDFADNVYFERYGYFKPYAELDPSGALVIRGYPLPNVDDFGFRERAKGPLLARILYETISNAFLLPPQAGLIGFRNGLIYGGDGLNASERRLADRAIRINDLLMARIRDAVRGAGATLVLLPAPTKCDYSESCRRGGKLGVRDAAHEVLSETAEHLGVLFVPTLDALDLSHFWERDGHWRPSGHARIAERLGDFLAGKGLLD